MISRKIAVKAKNDNYARLANYIEDASHKGEKALFVWHEGCDEEEYKRAIKEVQDVQGVNQRTGKEKTYHIVISFHPEDEHLLTQEKFIEVEKTFAKALGFEEHQRHCGVHKNTNNLHMHIAYNMIHPRTFNRHEPYRDYKTRDKVCREIEAKFGLRVDNGIDTPAKKNKLRDAAATVEAHTGQQSFEGYVKEYRVEFLATESWKDLHTALAKRGLEIKPHGNGLVFKDLNSKYAVKASSVAREFSLKKLEDRLGQYDSFEKTSINIEAQTVFDAKPLHRDPERGQLYAQFVAGIQERKETLESIKVEQSVQQAAVSEKYMERYKEVKAAWSLTWRDKIEVTKKLAKKEKEALDKIKIEQGKRRQTLNEKIPYTSWAAFLQMHAGQGNEVALAILRSREIPSFTEGKTEGDPKVNREQSNNLWKERIQEIKQAPGLTRSDKKALVAVTKMQQLCERIPELSGFTYSIDAKGTVLFKMPTGGMVRDNGKDITCSAHDPFAAKVSKAYALIRFGKKMDVEGVKTIEKAKDQRKGLER